jgi:pimeloyl-ACP methyl ester carboxylesterase
MVKTSEFTGLKAFVYRIPVIRMLVADKECKFAEFTPPRDPSKPIVILVHGTWSPTSEWTMRGSNMRNGIGAELQGCGWARFRWSGLNGLRSRLDASDGLVKAIQEIPERYAQTPLIAIGHSHGGNVVAWASTRLKTRLRAAAYLNTPFIQARTATSNLLSLNAAHVACA